MKNGRHWLFMLAFALVGGMAGYFAATGGTLKLPPDAILPDGGRYYGETRDGRFHGEGTIIWENGSRYEGGFVDGLSEGDGRYYSEDGSVYEGEFVEGQFHGEGKLTTSVGEVYEGTWKEGFITQGVFRDDRGNEYVGAFKDWRFHGEGEHTDEAGNFYQGTFRENRLEGHGVHEAPSGLRYEGEFEDGLYNGEGTVTWPSGERFVGTFYQGLRNGPGRLISASGAVIREGAWLQGSFLGADNQVGDRSRSDAIERAIYLQPRLIDKSLEDVAPGQPGQADLFFVGFAPYGDQDVFRKEIEFAAGQVARHLGAGDRTVLLINHPETLDSRALATGTSLERTLKQVSKLMNSEEDILFLYLTSHGSQDHELAIEQPGMELPNLGSEELASIINAVPAQWKIIGVSACYSGGFLEALRDERTLVMTSARADRTSFGCGQASDMTYFGKAYFRDALPATDSLLEAFEKAKGLVHEWENNEGVEHHSEPQVAMGEKMADHLKQWRRSMIATEP